MLVNWCLEMLKSWVYMAYTEHLCYSYSFVNVDLFILGVVEV